MKNQKKVTDVWEDNMMLSARPLLIAATVLIDAAIKMMKKSKKAKEDVQYLKQARSFINISMGE